MTPTLWIFDILLAVTLMGLAFRVLTAPDMFKAVVLFIVFGLLMAVAWTRLEAADIALAEAAIGAGLTGALFLNALGQRKARGAEEGERDTRWENTPPPSLLHRLPLMLLTSALAVVLAGIVWRLSPEAHGMALLIEPEVPRSGATNPVTAVLLNFRGYDTLLEIGVLLLAVVGTWSLGALPMAPRSEVEPGPVLLALVRALVPLIGVVAVYLLWIGTRAPGGAFQAGALLSAAGVLLMVSGIVRPPSLRSPVQRLVLVIGFVGFLSVALILMALGGRFLEYPPEWAGIVILVVEILLTASIAVILIALFAGGPAANPPADAPAEDKP